MMIVGAITGGFWGFPPPLLRAADPEPDLQPYIKALTHEDYHVRMTALDALARLGPKAAAALPALLKELDKAGSYLAAIHVLGAIGPAAAPAVPALLSRLTRTLLITDKYRAEPNEASGIIDTLAKIGPKAAPALPLVRSALKHPLSTIRYFAAHALGEIGPAAKVAIPELETRLNDHEYVGLYVYPYGYDVSAAAAQALHKLQGMANNANLQSPGGAWSADGAKATEPVPPDWKRIDAEGKFTFLVPPDMEAEAVEGTDSYVGQYRGNSLRLGFDYGQWSDDLCNAQYTAQKPQYAEVTTQIGGQQARLVTFYEPAPKMDYEFPYIAVVCFPDVGTEGLGGKITLTMWANGKGRAEQQTAEKIFQSIQFSR